MGRSLCFPWHSHILATAPASLPSQTWLCNPLSELPCGAGTLGYQVELLPSHLLFLKLSEFSLCLNNDIIPPCLTFLAYLFLRVE